MTHAERDRRVYALAKEYLLQMDVEGLTPQLLKKYLHLAEINPRPDTIPKIYQCLLESAQNANMKAGVIGGSIGGVQALGTVLHGFQPDPILENYARWEQVLDEIERRLQPKGEIRRTPRSIWPQYCRTILSGARFMMQFCSADDFHNWVSLFDQDDRTRIALPMLLQYEVYGFGFALACDFFKELGYTGFAKPDVHVGGISRGLGLCPSDAKDYQVFEAIVRVARNVGVTPYNVDRLFWLIGSGYFYLDEQIGRIGSHREAFIARAKKELGLEGGA